MKVNIKLKHKDVKLPQYATDGSGCFDIFPDQPSHRLYMIDQVRNTIVLDTGLFFEIPKGKVLLVYSRSGQGFNNNVRLANSVGVIDSDFRGELKVKLTLDGTGEFLIEPHKAIAQGMIIDAQQVQFNVVQELSETVRGTSGFGSTDNTKKAD